ncbi:hypothetical protein [Stenotrophomonas oahuensis]|uniref:Uncharacterized protein n=1 Tax=Stenotrophomonas oahuensis TaxID=3003271 RepID=A0ABY9YW03_9GAMM|nr:hypothetical protein [Stenotrophomonas sp. A5586]WNH54843.1 hypothetical protein PDM29_20735 [Stenotrophomonas sp. A5586]
MNSMIVDTPVSFGLSLEVLRGLRMEQLGEARRKVRELRSAGAQAFEIELAEQAVEEAREAVTLAQRMDDEEARSALSEEGITPCRS